jgi:hypothetical protein
MVTVEPKKIRNLIATLKLKGYVVKERPYELNIVGVRNDSTVPNKFDDFIYVFWKDDKGNWQGKYYTATTDAGTYWLLNPMSNLGAALLKEGQYKNSHKIGLHKGQYKALVQQNPVTVIRDYDRNAILDFNNGREETGIFGINIHRAGASGNTVDVGKWSAGCQVFQNADNFANFLELAEKSNKLYGNNFTYTLIDERALNRRNKRYGAFVIGGIIALAGLYTAYRTYKNLPLIPKM